MADERYWDQRTPREHVYIDVSGRVIGTLTESLVHKTFEATAYTWKPGIFVNFELGQRAVEAACVEFEAEAQRIAESRKTEEKE